MIAPIACILVLWVVWVLVWQIAARTAAPTVSRQALGPHFAQSLPRLSGTILLLLPSAATGIFGRNLLPGRPGLAWGAVAVVVVGLLLASWARFHLGRFWSGPVALKDHHALIRTGPYAWTRHPIYGGILLALTGTAAARGTLSAAAGLALWVVGFALKVRQEERLLLEHFGPAYRAYRAEVPAMVPRLWREQQPN